MKSKITPTDFFSLTEMMNEKIELSMNVATYKRILGTCFSDDNYEKIDPIPMINGVKIKFEDTKPVNAVSIIAKYIPHSAAQLDVEIL